MRIRRLAAVGALVALAGLIPLVGCNAPPPGGANSPGNPGSSPGTGYDPTKVDVGTPLYVPAAFPKLVAPPAEGREPLVMSNCTCSTRNGSR